MADQRRFGTFEAVFVPTLLTILGVVLYLRTGWVVGQVGLGGALLVMGTTFAITGLTAGAIAHAVRSGGIGKGGAFGLFEATAGGAVAGSIGIPLFLTQALVVALYAIGFRTGWQRIFPDHPSWSIDASVFAVLAAIAYASAKLAFRVQYLILAIIAGSLVSIFLAPLVGPAEAVPVTWWTTEGKGLAAVFAVFFPAATGILAGANLSGELKDPARSIPRGTLAAIALSTGVYLAVAAVLATYVPMQDLRDDERALIGAAAWGPAVLIGLLGATFSSALASLVGASRILQAIAASRVLPGTSWLARTDERGEPRQAILASGAVALAGLALRDLDAIATLLTVIFLTTYGSICAAVRWSRPPEGALGLVPILGGIGCVAAMLAVSPAWSALSITLMAATYLALRASGRGGPRET